MLNPISNWRTCPSCGSDNPYSLAVGTCVWGYHMDKMPHQLGIELYGIDHDRSPCFGPGPIPPSLATANESVDKP